MRDWLAKLVPIGRTLWTLPCDYTILPKGLVVPLGALASVTW